MQPSALEKAIIRTCVYFSYFHFPLSQREIHTWLLAPDRAYTKKEVEECLKKSAWVSARTDTFQGYISTESCKAWVEEREKKYIDAQRKYKKARKVAKILSYIPGIEAIAICNSLAWSATHAAGDIDYFIVTTQGKVWSTRLFATLPLKILKMRPGETANDPVCLSFFTDTQTLALEDIKEGEEDWYFAYWCMSLRWIAGSEEIQKMFLEKNPWIQKVLPHAQQSKTIAHLRAEIKRKAPLFIKESWARHVQERLFSEKINEKKNEGTHVIVNDHMLKFHEDDRRASITAYVRLHMQKQDAV